jgi:cytochrome c oxidase subunit 3
MTTRASPFDNPFERLSAARLGMKLFLVSLAVLFAASILGYLVLRLQAGRWLPADMPPLPRALWLSTIVLLASRGSMHLALLSIRANQQLQFRLSMLLTTMLGVLFLLVQLYCWMQMIRAHRAVAASLSDFPRYMVASFYVLTAIHALHVIGGIIPLAIVTGRAFARKYSPGYHAAVVFCSMYWHFLGVVWLVLFATLMLGNR